jgi:hypothetical protein
MRKLKGLFNPSDSSSRSETIPATHPDSLPQKKKRQNCYQRCIASIQAHRESHMNRGYRQHTSDEWFACNTRHAWILAGLYM